MSNFPETTSIYIGGLKSGIGCGKLKRHLIYLFRQIGLVVKKSQIFIVEKSIKYVFAFVNLEDKEAVLMALHHLEKPERRTTIAFDFSLIQEPNKVLKFDRRIFTKKDEMNEAASSDSSDDEESESEEGFLGPLFSQKFYHLGEKLGNETRNAEFKEGGFMVADKKHVISNTVGKYVCSFLNSDGGTLFLGVNNHGCVVGVACDQQQEDRYRLQIDEAIKRVHPPLFPTNYRVDFVQIRDDYDQILDLKVIEITVDKMADTTQLFDYNEDVYVRRDASIQCLKARELQEWTRKRVEKEHQQQREVHSQLAQVTTEMQKLKTKVGDESSYQQLRLQLQQVQEENNKLKKVVINQTGYPLERKKSKMCAIM